MRPDRRALRVPRVRRAVRARHGLRGLGRLRDHHAITRAGIPLARRVRGVRRDLRALLTVPAPTRGRGQRGAALGQLHRALRRPRARDREQRREASHPCLAARAEDWPVVRGDRRERPEARRAVGALVGRGARRAPLRGTRPFGARELRAGRRDGHPAHRGRDERDDRVGRVQRVPVAANRPAARRVRADAQRRARRRLVFARALARAARRGRGRGAHGP